MIRIVSLLVCLHSFLAAGEGMFPITMAARIALAEKGLKMNPADIFRTDSVSLAHAIVRLPGCTGSFVSEEGLILTNYHCSFNAIQKATTVEHDFIQNGFLAKTRTDESPIQSGYALILDQVNDISADILANTTIDMPSMERFRTIEQNRNARVEKAKGEFPGKKIEISEMMVGQSYYLFVYTRLRDIRLVYAPPQSIGQFGGETDNWIWPRHTGDFAFMRAYVAPDGSPADYSTDNVPYKPKRHLPLALDGAQEGDFVMLLGYPGRTVRHRSASFVEFEMRRIEAVGSLYEWEIARLEEAGALDRAIAILVAPRIENLANSAKRYRGQIKTLTTEDFVDRKRAQEKELMTFITRDKDRALRYSDVLSTLDSVYSVMSRTVERDALVDRLFGSVNMLRAALEVQKAATALTDSTDKSRAIDNVVKTVHDILSATPADADRDICREILRRMSRLPEDQRIVQVSGLFDAGDDKSLDRFVTGLYNSTKLADDNYLRATLKKSDKIASDKDPMLKLARTFEALRFSIQGHRKQWDAELSRLYPLLTEVRRQFLKTDFIPDANFTMRLTYGHIRGYAPADAVVYRPQTMLSGIIAKTGAKPFDTPGKLIELYKAKAFGKYRLKNFDDVPVCMLYDSDTTGGNSGSPVLDAYGRLVGLNFDRAFEATVNDFAWSDAYSRSIGVDVRYILWVMEYFSGATDLLKEVKVI